jgi:hypothetical protein
MASRRGRRPPPSSVPTGPGPRAPSPGSRVRPRACSCRSRPHHRSGTACLDLTGDRRGRPPGGHFALPPHEDAFGLRARGGGSVDVPRERPEQGRGVVLHGRHPHGSDGLREVSPKDRVAILVRDAGDPAGQVDDLVRGRISPARATEHSLEARFKAPPR